MNSSRPLVSVVMPLFNHESYVEEAVNSVLSQSYKNFELIIIDDCSKDASVERLSQFQDGRIRTFFHAENLGAHATINEGVSLARGEYVSLINSDDIYKAQRLDTLYGLCTNNNVSLAGTAMELIDEKGKRVRSAIHWWNEWYNDLVKCYIDTGDLNLALLRGNFFITTSNFFFRRSLVDQIGQFQAYRYVHDYEFLLRAASHAGVRVVFFHDQPLLSYRLHRTNTIRENAKEANRETFDILIDYGSKCVAADLRKGHAALLAHLQKIRHYLEDAYERSCCGDNSTNEGVNREVNFLRNEILKITATRGYRFEKALYEFYLRVRNLMKKDGVA